MKLPDDMFRQELLPYLTVYDIANLDIACIHKYRHQLMDKISGVILIGYRDKSIKTSIFKWLGMRGIFLVKMLIVASDFHSSLSSIENDYVDQFRYTQHVVMRGSIRDDMAIFILSHCSCILSSISLLGDYDRPIDSGRYPRVTDLSLQSIAEHCTGLQSLNLDCCRQITDSSIISISTHCTGLKSLNLDGCRRIEDAGVISISTHCTGLQSLNLELCQLITNASIISISSHCTRLQSLNLDGCSRITDASIISISFHCTGLQSLSLSNCKLLTDASITSISINCTGLQSLYLGGCHKITDESIISISTHCIGLKRLNILGTKITDASLIAIAKKCNRIQLLNAYGCDGLSSRELSRGFKSVSKLRAVLLSIDPSLPI